MRETGRPEKRKRIEQTADELESPWSFREARAAQREIGAFARPEGCVENGCFGLVRRIY
mgnify:CR=1 FL=1